MVRRIFLAAVLAAIILFIWSAVSWMLIPWHTPTLNKFTDQNTVAATIQANAPKSGVYLMPQYSGSSSSAAPMVFAAVSLTGMKNMIPAMIISFFIDFAAAILVAYLLARTVLISYGSRLIFVMVFALAAGILGYLPYWNWWGFSFSYSLVGIVDLLIGWLFAGLVMAAILKPVTIQHG